MKLALNADLLKTEMVLHGLDATSLGRLAGVSAGTVRRAMAGEQLTMASALRLTRSIEDQPIAPGMARHLAAHVESESEKMALVYVEGRLQTRSWLKDDEKRTTTEINATDVEFLESREPKAAPVPVGRGQDVDVDDIPF